MQLLVGNEQKNLKRDPKYLFPRVEVVAGAEPAALVREKRFAKFVVGVESAQGKAILRILESERPWEWHGRRSIPHANHLVFIGHYGQKSWDYSTGYPDPRLEALFRKVRHLLADKRR